MDGFVKAITAAIRLLKERGVLQACAVTGTTVSGGLMLGPTGALLAANSDNLKAALRLCTKNLSHREFEVSYMRKSCNNSFSYLCLISLLVDIMDIIAFLPDPTGGGCDWTKGAGSVGALMNLPLWLDLAPLLLNILYELGVYHRAKEFLLQIAQIIINVINRHKEQKSFKRAVEWWYGCKHRDSSPPR